MGRNAQPVSLIQAKGRSNHLTKKVIAERKAHEEKLRSGNPTPKQAPEVRENDHAKKMFSRLKKLYKDIDYVEALDENAINRYCLLHAEHSELVRIRQSISRWLEGADIDPERAESMLDKLLDVERRLEKKRDQLIKLEDRLFLNPTSRVKSVPKKAKEPEVDPNAELFS